METPYIWNQDTEPVAKADCGCTLEDSFKGYPAFWQCPLHAAAPDCYESLREVLQAFYERIHNSQWTDDDKEMIRDAENALAKAKGKA